MVLYAQFMNSNCWDVRNIAKISPKVAKNVLFRFFFYVLKNGSYDWNEIFYSHSTPYYGCLCAFKMNSYGWDVRNIAKISPKMAKNSNFSIFFRFSQKLFIRFERNFLQSLYTTIKSVMCNGIKLV